MNAQNLIIKGIVSDMPEADRTKIKECEEKIRALLKEYGEHGLMALAVVGSEQSE